MKHFTVLTSLALVLAFGAGAVADHHKGSDKKGSGAKSAVSKVWFDAPHCDYCKPMADREDLMMSTKWETHKLDNGMLMTAIVPEDMLSEYAEVCEAMQKSWEKGQAKMVCGFCDSFGKLVAAGAKMQEVKTGFGSITIVTSDDKATVKSIHSHADRSIEEAKKMAMAH